jgi:hypothetical protein
MEEEEEPNEISYKTLINFIANSKIPPSSPAQKNQLILFVSQTIGLDFYQVSNQQQRTIKN